MQQVAVDLQNPFCGGLDIRACGDKAMVFQHNTWHVLVESCKCRVTQLFCTIRMFPGGLDHVQGPGESIEQTGMAVHDDVHLRKTIINNLMKKTLR